MARAEEKVIALIEQVKETYPAISKDDIRHDQVRDYAKRIADLKEKREQLVQKMVEVSQDKREYHILISFPGIGETPAVRIIGELGDIRRFKSQKP